MRLIIAGILLMTTFLSGADLIVDHVTVAGSNLRDMQSRLASIGISSEFGGLHSNHATQMALTSFADGSYLELIALQENPDAAAVAAHEWSKQLRENAGPAAWAVRAVDVSKEAERLRAAGVKVSAPIRNGRKRPDGTQLDWETARVGDEPNGTFFPFLIRDFTPRSARALPSGKPTNTAFNGITRVVIMVRDLKKAEARYREAYGLPAAVEQDDATLGARLASFQAAPIVLAGPLNRPLGGRSWYLDRIAQFGEGPCAFVLGHAAAKSQRLQVEWLDSAKLGWHLGVEK